MKDCFGLHGHSAFGSVAKGKSGVGRLSATSGVQTTDLVHWLQAGKTVDISRCASESTGLLPPSALLRPHSRPAAFPALPQSNGISRAYSKAAEFIEPKTPVTTAIALKSDYDAKYGAPSEGAPKVFVKYFYVNTATGEKSGEMLALAKFEAEED